MRFEGQGIAPYEVNCEELAADPPQIATKILDWLGLQVPTDHRLAIRRQRQSDHVNDEWIRAYKFR